MNPTRRRMLTGTGLVGAFAAGFFAPKVVVEVKEKLQQPKIEDIRHLAPLSSTTLMLTADNRTAEEKQKENPPMIGNGFYIQPMEPHKETNKVTMSVGKDNRLWIQVDGQWRIVALDPSWCDPTYCDPAEEA